jgi:rSAM/selenodomain-associated transferase 1
MVFARAPVPGQVKTRLAAAIGDRQAAAVHETLLRDTVAAAAAARLAPLELHVASDHAVFEALSKRYGAGVRLQTGVDLGERMYNALETAVGGGRSAVLIGSDCPVLNADYLLRAFAVLEDGDDAVLGPVEDGGYVLIGLRRCDERLFSGIAWSTAQVSAVTRRRLDRLGFSYRELDTLWDIDDVDDYLRWQRCRGTAGTG